MNFVSIAIIIFMLWTILIFIVIHTKVSLADNTVKNTIFSNEFQITSLMKAAANDDKRAIEIFLNNDANINETNLAGQTALHIAVRHRSHEALLALLQYKPKIKVDAQDFEGWTPLMRACLFSDPESVRILIENQAKIFLKNNFNESSITIAVSSNCEKCVYFILKNMPAKWQTNQIIAEQIKKAEKIVSKKQNSKMTQLLADFKNNKLGSYIYENSIENNLDINTKEIGNTEVSTGKLIKNNKSSSTKKSGNTNGTRRKKDI